MDELSAESIAATWAKATPGPWTARGWLGVEFNERQWNILTADDDFRPIGVIYGENAVWLADGASDGGNAIAIAAAPSHIAWLLAENARLLAEMHDCRMCRMTNDWHD